MNSIISNYNKDIVENLVSQQLQIEALVALLPKEKQDEWLKVLNDIGSKRGINPTTGKRI